MVKGGSALSAALGAAFFVGALAGGRAGDPAFMTAAALLEKPAGAPDFFLEALTSLLEALTSLLQPVREPSSVLQALAQ